MRTRRGKKGKSAEKAQLEKLDEKFAAEISELTKRLVAKLWTLLQGKATTGITDYFGVELYPAGTKFSQKLLEEIARKSTDEKTGVVMGYLNLGSCKWTGDAHTDALIEATINNYTIEWKKADAVIKREKYNITNGDELPQTGVIQMAKVYIANVHYVQRPELLLLKAWWLAHPAYHNDHANHSMLFVLLYPIRILNTCLCIS